MHYLIRYLDIKPPAAINCQNFPPACFTSFSEAGEIIFPLIYGGAFLLLLIFGGKAAFDFMTSQGDPKQLEKARNSLVFSFIGILLIFLAYFFTRLVGSLFNIDLLV
ncbi:hypothetical protein A3B02_00735 [Candidatus Roizmanbacteria bacterium RIFCSPLOWO2_01_FULL_42_14]|uniref:Uncharacterized protein n=4 Tax=Candidatus Roizmaniibacteriota TaxID=1752723 RepID=A0A1F7K1W5_9BACT|nr:MAG: hypothetical protein A3D08_01570 [Candidatus Roizmanbacteria bacterium RIFCSPHIGHO2_02_FULL_43_11]OGK38839.1 MAG: hypothetical protein A3F32_02045 [Candidatus Roizmanbacteria bacterium RIFCSPHIGHO2_12_FULL_42_10]OGK52608.1 MAG: hypothetical protein A3B02_00735 [Candidatus Roizmanbacteria bacterium RIFCSPLOWO2_01_FULL_42_14]OGK61860.1 MAG: hypothetical protein A3I56_02765 [Candidatus Roizmanbacteria bacterium RIFCSPLOWO2_02_FULL_43_10]